MARKDQLRRQRSGTVLNLSSGKQESDVAKALLRVEKYLGRRFPGGVSIGHEKQWYLRDIVARLRHDYPHTGFHCHFDRTSIRPDGGILHLRAQADDRRMYPILIAEVKNQGTNDLRLREGLARQA